MCGCGAEQLFGLGAAHHTDGSACVQCGRQCPVQAGGTPIQPTHLIVATSGCMVPKASAAPERAPKGKLACAEKRAGKLYVPTDPSNINKRVRRQKANVCFAGKLSVATCVSKEGAVCRHCFCALPETPTCHSKKHTHGPRACQKPYTVIRKAYFHRQSSVAQDGNR